MQDMPAILFDAVSSNFAEDITMSRLAVTGAAGRMGRRIIELAREQQLEVVAALEGSGNPQLGQPVAGGEPIITDSCDADYDVLVDFSVAQATLPWLAHARLAGKPVVIGTTGHTKDQLFQVEQTSRDIPVLKAANMSLGVNLLLRLAAEVARALGTEYDIEVVEGHHRFKTDAPSGTALALVKAMCDAAGLDSEKGVVHGRHGQTGQRPKGQIGVHALRMGDVVGQHQVHFSTLGETITLSHTAHSRDTFVHGALRAAEWIIGKPNGLYSMHDVLFGDRSR
jgi:4-hydroxy-tetrahydrodipicolinate reductase